MSFPARRLRRLRRTPALRRLARETRLSPADFIAPLFLVNGRGVRREIPSMPGVFHLSPDEAVKDARALAALGVSGVLVFGIPDRKDDGAAAWDPEGPVPTTLRALRDAKLDLALIADVCLCEYTEHGHCGVLDPATGLVDNDRSLPMLAKAAVAYGRAGADIVAPSDMMDGRVRALRSALDDAALADTAILSYAAKFASAFYGPFRDAAGSAPSFGDRKSYQMGPPNRREALAEIALDIEEGADLVMVKPALAYLDIIREARERFDVPIAAYNVSGEYAMVKQAAKAGALEERRAALEILTSIRRAGADLILTYYAAEASRWLAEGSEG
jgi:porphobilinogen synthase